MKWTWTGKLFVWYWVKNWGWEKFVPKWCTGISPSNSGLSAVDIQMHYGKAAACLLTWSRTLRLLFISKSKISGERTPFWVNRRHPEGCNAGLKRRPTKCVPGMLQRTAALLEKMCAGTRDVLWRWPHRSWWINKIKLFFWNQSHYFTVGPRMSICLWALWLLDNDTSRAATYWSFHNTDYWEVSVHTVFVG